MAVRTAIAVFLTPECWIRLYIFTMVMNIFLLVSLCTYDRFSSGITGSEY